MPLDPEALADIVALAIRTHTAPLVARITVLEGRAALVPRDGRDGQPGPMGEPGQPAGRGEKGEPGTSGAPGRDADEARVLLLEADVKALRDQLIVIEAAPVTATIDTAGVTEIVKAMVDEAVAAEVAQLQPRDGQDGSSVTLEDVAPLIKAAAIEAVAALPAAKDGAPGERGEPGQSVDVADVIALVNKAVAEIPRPKDGASVTVDDVRPLIVEQVEKAVAAIPPARDGKDGIGVAGVLIDRDGQLVATLSDGTVKACGVVVGKDGRDGRDADMAVLQKHIHAELEKWPKPKDGEPGAPGTHGRDGTLEDVKFVQSQDFRTVTICRKDGTPVEGGVITFPSVIDRGVFKAGETYQPGDGVTWAGSFWIAQRETSGKPGEGDSGFRLSVKRGGDGKEGKPGINGKDGAPGPPGRDGTRAY